MSPQRLVPAAEIEDLTPQTPPSACVSPQRSVSSSPAAGIESQDVQPHSPPVSPQRSVPSSPVAENQDVQPHSPPVSPQRLVPSSPVAENQDVQPHSPPVSPQRLVPSSPVAENQDVQPHSPPVSPQRSVPSSPPVSPVTALHSSPAQLSRDDTEDVLSSHEDEDGYNMYKNQPVVLLDCLTVPMKTGTTQ